MPDPPPPPSMTPGSEAPSARRGMDARASRLIGISSCHHEVVSRTSLGLRRRRASPGGDARVFGDARPGPHSWTSPTRRLRALVITPPPRCAGAPRESLFRTSKRWRSFAASPATVCSPWRRPRPRCWTRRRTSGCGEERGFASVSERERRRAVRGGETDRRDASTHVATDAESVLAPVGRDWSPRVASECVALNGVARWIARVLRFPAWALYPMLTHERNSPFHLRVSLHPMKQSLAAAETLGFRRDEGETFRSRRRRTSAPSPPPARSPPWPSASRRSCATTQTTRAAA